MASITVLAPDYEAARPAAITAAPRHLPAAGDVLTLVDNGKPNARMLLSLLAEDLCGRVPGLAVDVHRKASAGVSIGAADAGRIAARSRLVLTGVGD